MLDKSRVLRHPVYRQKKRTCLWRVAKPTKPQNKAPTNTLTLVLKTRVLPSGYEVLFPSLIYRLLRPLRNVYS